MPTSVAGIAVRGRRIFVARRKPGGSLGGLWEFPGGKCELGESPESALKREFLEELGLAISLGECLGTSEFTKQDVRFELKAYRIEFEGDPPILAEHDEVDWVDRETLRTLDFAPSDKGLFPFLPF